MAFKAFSIALLISVSTALVVGGYTKQNKCTNPSNLSSPYDLLNNASNAINSYVNKAFQGNVKVVLIKTQVVAGQNFLAVFQSVDVNVAYVGVQAYIGLDNSVTVKKFVYNENLDQVFAGLGIASESTRDLNCAVSGSYAQTGRNGAGLPPTISQGRYPQSGRNGAGLPPVQNADSYPQSGRNGAGLPPTDSIDSYPQTGRNGAGVAPIDYIDSYPQTGRNGAGLPPTDIQSSSYPQTGRNGAGLPPTISQNAYQQTGRNGAGLPPTDNNQETTSLTSTTNIVGQNGAGLPPRDYILPSGWVWPE